MNTNGNRSAADRKTLRRRFADAVKTMQMTRRQLACMIVCLPVFAGIYYLSYWLRFEGQLGAERLDEFYCTVVWVVAVKLLIFGWFRIYQGWGRYVTFYDLVVLIQAATGSLMLTVLINRLLLPEQAIPRSVFLMDWGATIVAVGGARALLRLIQEGGWTMFLAADQVPAFIVGANDAGESLLRAITRNEALTYKVAGFIDDDPKRQGTRIGGVPVVGTIDQTCQLALRFGVREVLIAMGELSGKQVRRLVDDGRRHSVRVKVLPSYEQLINGSVGVQPRSVAIEDLLHREPVRLDMENIREWIDDRVLLVTGSAGSIGSEICRQLLKFSPRRIVLLDRSENGQFFLQRELRELAGDIQLEVCIADILDETRVRGILEQHRPNIVFHAAAYKHVPLMEAHPGEAVKNIVITTRRLADLAIRCGVESFVMISTDKAVNPTSIMGACKRVAELYVQSLAELSPCRFVTVRFGNVLDSAGSVVQVFREQINRGGPIAVTDRRMQRYFMTIPEAARLVIQAGTIGKGGEILVLDMGDPVRIVDLAADMVRLSGLRLGKDVEIEFVGLRPGEKLFEELHLPGEKHLPTRHPKITVADRNRRDRAAVLNSVEALQEIADEAPEVIVEQLQMTLPNYETFRQPTQPARSARQAAA